MKQDIFISQAFNYSKKRAATVKTYSDWIFRLCQHANKPHPLDIGHDDILRFYLFLHDEKQYSRASLEIVRASIKYFYCVLLRKEAPEVMRCNESLSKSIGSLFAGRRIYKKGLPIVADRERSQCFLKALPATNTGAVIRTMYDTGKTFETIMKDIAPLKVSKAHAQKVCQHIARQVGIEHGFGLRGVRAAGIVNRIRNRKTDNELKQIQEDAGLKYQQFRLYRKAAGDMIKKNNI